jgi:hypothetical protein
MRRHTNLDPAANKDSFGSWMAHGISTPQPKALVMVVADRLSRPEERSA